VGLSDVAEMKAIRRAGCAALGREAVITATIPATNARRSITRLPDPPARCAPDNLQAGEEHSKFQTVQREHHHMLSTSTTPVLRYAKIQPCPDAFEVAFGLGRREA
jgi:hypothetical protein